MWARGQELLIGHRQMQTFAYTASFAADHDAGTVTSRIQAGIAAVKLDNFALICHMLGLSEANIVVCYLCILHIGNVAQSQ